MLAYPMLLAIGMMRKSSTVVAMILGLALGLGGGLAASGADTTVWREIAYAPDRLITPPGQDDQHAARVVLEGSLPGNCYRNAPAEVLVEAGYRRIWIVGKAFRASSCWCVEQPIPYTQEVALGVLPEGRYDVLITDQRHMILFRGSLDIGRGIRESYR